MLLLLTSACVKETSGFEGGGEPDEGPNVGYLALASLDATIEERLEEIGPARGTRAANTDLDSYMVEILDAQGNPVEITDGNGEPTSRFAYGDRPELIELPVGRYTLSVCSGPTPDVAREGDEGSPTYGATQIFTIIKEQTSTLQNMTCRLLTVRATVAYKDTLIATMSDDTQSELVLSGDRSFVFEGVYPEDIVYLKPKEGQTNPLILYLTTVFDGKPITRQPLQVAKNAKAGEWRRIEVNIQHAEDGTIIINAEVETWVAGKPVDVDVVTLAALCEEPIPDENDPNAPKLEWPGHALDEPIRLTQDEFDEEGHFIAPCDFTMTSTTPITSFEIAITTNNAAFRNLLEANELTQPCDMFTVEGPARTLLRSWGFQAIHLNVTERTFSLADLMRVLFDYEGRHTFTLTLANEAGMKSSYALAIEVDPSGGADPRIKWDGYDIKQRYDTFEGMEVNIKVTATQGVASLLVSIEGALDLDGMIPAQFDLTDPEAAMEGLGATLRKFGFPTGDEVIGQTELDFSITTFIPLLDTFKGDSDFRLTVVDAAGNTATEAIMLRVN